jgi:hypothetical protein
MKRLAQWSVIVLISLLASNARAESQRNYNAMTGHWESVGEESSLRYNSMTNRWSEQPEDATVDYNVLEDTWDWSSGHDNGGGDDV